MEKFLVSEKHVGPDNKNCMYCFQPVGKEHKDCVLVKKRVKLKVEVEYETDVPYHWDKDDIEFHRNGSSWCATNILSEIEEFEENDKFCLCEYAYSKYIEDTSGPFMRKNK